MQTYFCALKKKRTLACSRCCTEGLQKSVYVCTANTDVMVLVIAAFKLIVDSLWYWILHNYDSTERVCATQITSDTGCDTTSSLILQEEASTVKTEACCAHTNSVRSTLQFLQWEDGMKHVERFSWAQSSICTCKKTWTVQLLRLCSFNVQPY